MIFPPFLLPSSSSFAGRPETGRKIGNPEGKSGEKVKKMNGKTLDKKKG